MEFIEHCEFLSAEAGFPFWIMINCPMSFLPRDGAFPWLRPMAGFLPRSRQSKVGGSNRRSFTLVEAMVSLSLMAIAGSAALLGIQSALQSSEWALYQVIALGLAEQMIDEVAGARYMELGANPYDTNFRPGWDEAALGTREIFDDTDDYHNVNDSPPLDRWGIPLGSDDGTRGKRHPGLIVGQEILRSFRVNVAVYYVARENLSVRLPPGAVSDFRAIEVTVTHTDPRGRVRPLCTLRRIVAYVQPL